MVIIQRVRATVVMYVLSGLWMCPSVPVLPSVQMRVMRAPWVAICVVVVIPKICILESM